MDKFNLHYANRKIHLVRLFINKMEFYKKYLPKGNITLILKGSRNILKFRWFKGKRSKLKRFDKQKLKYLNS